MWANPSWRYCCCRRRRHACYVPQPECAPNVCPTPHTRKPSAAVVSTEIDVNALAVACEKAARGSCSRSVKVRDAYVCASARGEGWGPHSRPVHPTPAHPSAAHYA